MISSFFFSGAGECEEGWQCKQRVNCPRFLQEEAKLGALPRFSPEWPKLATELKGLECDEEEDGVCCRTQFEIVGGELVTRVEDFPFVARIHIKTGFGTSSFCGASLIHWRLLLTAKHCVEQFYEQCEEERDCYAHFRDLVPGITNHEKGEFTVPLIDMFEKDGRSDLAILKLAYAVCTLLSISISYVLRDSFQVHEDPAYEMGFPIEPINLGIEEPKPGDVAITAAHRAK